MLPISIKYPIQKGKDGFFEKTYTTIDTYRSNINILLRTNEGELPFDYDFGLPLLSSLFELAGEDLISYLDETIRRKIKKYIPGVSISKLTLSTEDLDNNKININLKFTSVDDPFNIKELIIGL